MWGSEEAELRIQLDMGGWTLATTAFCRLFLSDDTYRKHAAGRPAQCCLSRAAIPLLLTWCTGATFAR